MTTGFTARRHGWSRALPKTDLRYTTLRPIYETHLSDRFRKHAAKRNGAGGGCPAPTSGSTLRR